MATPDAEETVAAPSTAEAVVAEAVRADGGDKEAVKSTSAAETIPAATPEEAPKSTEAVAPETTAESVEQELPEAAPVEPSIPEFKEESNLVADLKENEKKALEDFKLRIEKAIKDDEFRVPKKVVEVPKEPEPVAAPAAPVEEKKDADATTTAAAPDAAAPSSTETPAAPTAETSAPVSVEAVKEETAVAVAVVAAVEEKLEAAPKEESVAAPTPTPTTTEAVPPPATPEVQETTPAPEAAPAAVEAPAAAAPPAVEAESPPAAAAVETESKEEAAPAAAEVAKEAPVEEEPEDTTPPEDIALWGVPLLHTKGDKRTDVILLKFLRARDFNVNDAFSQLKKTIIWRKTFKADTLLDEEFGTDLDGFAYMHGKDKEGHPVCYNVYGFEDKELYQKTFGDSSKINAFLRWRIQVLEKGIKLLNFSPEGPSAMVQITDLKNTPGPGKKDLKKVANQAVVLLQDNYPELVAKKVFINVPWYFSALYSIVSPFLSQRTKSKFVVAPAGKTTEALLKFIPAEYVPVNYGGLSRLNDTEFSGVEAPASDVIVKAGEKSHIEIPVTEVGGTVVWDLAVVGYDVSYGAEYVPSAEGAYTTIIEKTKKLPSSTEEPVRNSFKITEPGKVVLTVDNSSRKKKIVIYRHTVKVAPAAESELAG
ncbi:phosphatidylinositol transfer protein SFH5 [Marchantia polymorpha subsp. ruderalis]